jgi:KDO2-lipid IV(A) lauroyltransferase
MFAQPNLAPAPPSSEDNRGCNIRNIHPSWLGRLAYQFLPIRRKVIMENIRTVFGEDFSQADTRRLAECFYGNFGALILETFTTAWLSQDEIRRRVRVDNVEILLNASEKGKGILLLTGHFGNWEFTPVGAILNFPMFKGRIHVLRKFLGSKAVEKFVFSRYHRVGLHVIPKRNGLGRVLEALAKNDLVVFIMDQYARPGRDGILVDFFGKSAGTFKSLAVIARETGAAVVPSLCYREAGGRHVMKIFEPLPWIENEDSDAEILENTRQYNKMLEKMVLERPDQWFWAHRRWKVK